MQHAPGSPACADGVTVALAPSVGFCVLENTRPARACLLDGSRVRLPLRQGVMQEISSGQTRLLKEEGPRAAWVQACAACETAAVLPMGEGGAVFCFLASGQRRI